MGTSMRAAELQYDGITGLPENTKVYSSQRLIGAGGVPLSNAKAIGWFSANLKSVIPGRSTNTGGFHGYR